MHLPLHPTPLLQTQLTTSTATGNQLPLLWLNSEPFLIELQGSLELPGRAGVELKEGEREGMMVGWVDLEKTKPLLHIAHHRLEGSIVALPTPYAILRTTPAPVLPPSKRARLSSPSHAAATSSPVKPPPTTQEEEKLREELDEESKPRIEIVGLVRRKVVFSKRPEMMVKAASAGAD
ncbi:hypothetical protein BCR35DRAFT_305411 [Leucosporidium creatinivorum]|uniref:Ctf8-domain-containing protein n=1 Tax=Leucosporidium creatinivorum TaxID=106004 RepID=A0A1Y2F1A8_9BASI|nr:hypothetical protein BCR35DRAFT_305411 [Leucosporidium creatinivorum]